MYLLVESRHCFTFAFSVPLPSLSRHVHVGMKCFIGGRATLLYVAAPCGPLVVRATINTRFFCVYPLTNVQLFSDYFNQAPKLNIPGYTFPVEEFYLEV